MTPQELMIPRYKVISDWPGRRDFELNEIIVLDKLFGSQRPCYEIEDCKGVRQYIEAFFKMFPLQFKKVRWWEERNPEELPEYVKFCMPLPQEIDIRKVWDFEVYKDGKCIVRTICFNNHIPIRQELSPRDLPATESDYRAYINKQL